MSNLPRERSVNGEDTSSGILSPIVSDLFTLHASAPMLTALTLERSANGEDTSGSVLSVGEYDPRFTNVSATPSSSSRWTLVMSSMSVNGKDYTLTSDVEASTDGSTMQVRA
ncbi:hypothetical protein PAXINDRAFT_13866 [Paxillus involutus ATCC 200175]|uniref:Uncharacterized protein n=1 Tax=Paxillus involutus ATCC 200175 TaxID=664439 RepID=A0A0C9U1G8_PAXIN|nr:hypothetical protein PAXINDRAFT_13866 [Paxillus involutus ATCC 200175]